MVARQMLKYRHLLVAAPSLLAQFGQPASVEDLHRYPCASWAADSSARGLWRLGHQVFEPKAVLVANDYALLRSRAVAGQAVTELPPFMANKEIAAGRLCAVLPSHPLPEQTLSLLYPSQRHPSRLVRAYLDFCQEQLKTYLSANVE